FTPFFSTKEQGQGLGLTLVQEILRQHRCEFALDGPPGGPSRFTIVFPASLKGSLCPEPEAPRGAQEAGARRFGLQKPRGPRPGFRGRP
ncbi:MAG TPA: hypothetical protein VE359_23170, partial [Vicinamibacteria bacterium]|nr:hypothetical protein [Vicinamibacteria bacterium]